MTETKDKIIEREYIIPLRKKCKIVPRYKKTNKAVKTVKEFLARHMKIEDRDLDKIKIDKYLNEALWSRGIRHPPSKIKVKVKKEGDIVRVEALELSDKIKYKKAREEKIIEKGKERAKEKKEEKTEKKEEEQVQKDEEEKKEEVKEDKIATVEAGKEIQKEESKKAKHETQIKSPKQQKNMKSGYNRSSQGH